MRNLVITFEEISGKENSHAVYFEGDFDGAMKDNIVQVQSFVDEAAQNTNLIFDFTKLHYLNSYAIGQLVNWHNILNKKGGKIFIVGASKDVLDIFAILGISALFRNYPDLNAVMVEL